MKEPKRLAHRQAERNKARALKHWEWDEDEAAELHFAESSVQADTGAEKHYFAGITAHAQF